MRATLTGLSEYTNYSITVFASTAKGNGNISAPIIVITDEDSKFPCGCILIEGCVLIEPIKYLYTRMCFGGWLDMLPCGGV